MRRSTLLVVTCLTASLAVAPAAWAAPGSAATATPASPAKPGSHVQRVLVGGGTVSANPAAWQVSASPRPARPARVPHLDPRLQTESAPAGATVAVTVSGSSATVAAQVRHLGGRILAAVPGTVSAVVPRAKLAALAGSAGVSSVDAPTRAFVDAAGPSEGVTASHADAWQGASDTGAGVKVGIVDAGFANLADEVSAQHLPATTTVNGDHCADVNDTQHGTAVAEIVHQMAPDAQLLLYCVDDNIGFAAAEGELHDAGVTIVNSSLGFPGDSRGDGTGAAHSTATTVKRARQDGILWIQSAGNNGFDHWGATFTDADRNRFDDLNGTGEQADYVAVPQGGFASFFLQWDGWPTSNVDVGLQFAPTDTVGGDPSGPVTVLSQQDGTAPVLAVCFAPGGAGGCLDSSGFDPDFGQLFGVSVKLPASFPHVHFDLSYWGDVSNNVLSCPSEDSNGNCNYSARAAAGSITEPASSPYVLAVGADDVGADGFPGLEAFSSQGPTIDGRVKPDITGWDGVSSFLPEFDTGFFGTSAAAPHVAGAAALVAGLHPAWDAAQLQNYLEQQASDGHPSNPPTNQTGHGTLTLGSPAAAALPATSRYRSLASPKRILDTRAGRLPTGNKGALGTAQTRTIKVPTLPPDATAVAVNLTGIGARSATFVSAYPGGTAWPRTSNLNLSSTDPTAAVFAIVTLGAGQTITIRNNQSPVNVAVDLLGYFGTGSETGRYSAVPARRVLDTRTTLGGHLGRLGVNKSVTVRPAVPAGASAAIVNITVADTSGSGGYVNAAATCSIANSTLNFTRYARANLAIVTLDGSGHFCIKDATSPANVLVDVLGYLSPAAASSYVALPAPVRIVDTRTGNGGAGNGGPPAPLHSGTSDVFWGAGIYDVPKAATALFTGVLAVNATKSGYFSLFPGIAKPAGATSTLNFSAGRIVPNAAIVGLNSEQFGLYNNLGSTDGAIDLFGYFV